MRDELNLDTTLSFFSKKKFELIINQLVKTLLTLYFLTFNFSLNLIKTSGHYKDLSHA
tara:strand:+ start:169 stop:342 length:174 start_codon:yes stop_codon:yes gene_type:complete